ncbi:peptidoglycan/xylan/chitin deacetylase (PgdA/CDA1 family) [Pseudarthrobacter defluvii]|uniref:polysaccharide deacetylase family protein n=1 Tax=Pseudarthrobacter defluvii TaxID=410837 RepID=UPI00278641B1|nr:polysaccharide deacetylase family protein [Pseudarthrobacter defluvii]MDQ0770586.1 peptidoglycan/xylan/chitin deacetylase (PgdA/CDA1 family) [Pseudarthrobacter defluvii]
MEPNSPPHLGQDGKGPGRRAVLVAAVLTLSAAVPELPPHSKQPPDTQGTAQEDAGAAGVSSTIMHTGPDGDETAPAPASPSAASVPSRAQILDTFGKRQARYWGLEAPGVLTRLPPGAQGIALTFDFCGGSGGNGYDQALLDTLRQRRVPATLFLNSRWITANAATARQLAADPLFEVANHGTSHKPLSTTGNTAYGIPGTRNAGEVYDEIMPNDGILANITGKRPRYFRPGTAYMDDVAVDILGAVGVKAAGFSINGDGGATFPAAVVAKEVGRARAGDVVICHGNHPHGGTAEGVMQALDKLLTAGMSFIHLP